MAKDREPASSIFDIQKVRQLIELMREHELTEVDLRESDQRVRLRRGGDPVFVQTPVAAPAAVAAAASSGAPDTSQPPVAEGVLIRSPTIGTFYASPKPGAAPFVKMGDMVSPDTIVCMVEAMKMFNEIPAGVSGKIVEILVQNEDSVDNNKPLFRVLPS